MNIHTIYITLLVLTGASAWAASAQHGNLALLLGLGCVKFLLVAFYFMELKHTHLFWKGAVTITLGGIFATCWLLV